MTSLEFVIVALTVWRISALISYEDGPFNVFRWIRERIGIEHYDDGTKIEKEYKGLASLFYCVWCISLWIGLFAAAMYWQRPILTVMFSLPFALSAGAIVVERINHG